MPSTDLLQKHFVQFGYSDPSVVKVVKYFEFVFDNVNTTKIKVLFLLFHS